MNYKCTLVARNLKENCDIQLMHQNKPNVFEELHISKRYLPPFNPFIAALTQTHFMTLVLKNLKREL